MAYAFLSPREHSKDPELTIFVAFTSMVKKGSLTEDICGSKLIISISGTNKMSKGP